MSLLNAYRNPALASRIIESIQQRGGEAQIMEFCGGHTVSIFRNGIRTVLPASVRMMSGPGCPVCVTSNADLDKAIALSRTDKVILATYGDMLKVPGSRESLLEARATGAKVEIVYSTLDALALAERFPENEIVFFAIGFETTAPAAAAAILKAKEKGLENFSVCSVMKLTVPGARALLDMGEVRIDGIIGPGHVSTIIGSEAWRFLVDEYRIPVAISGFEPVDILAAVDSILSMLERGKPDLTNCYSRTVRSEGNRKAWGMVEEVFEPGPSSWRGFGELPESGLQVRREYAAFDAERRFVLLKMEAYEHPSCRCGEVLRGVIEPEDCRVFGTACTPETPLGPCMVSSEGSCAAHYQFGGTVAR